MVNGAAKCRQSSKFRIDVPFLITPPDGVPILAAPGAPREAGERPGGPEKRPSTTWTVHVLGLNA